jgi:hypothetical protein
MLHSIGVERRVQRWHQWINCGGYGVQCKELLVLFTSFSAQMQRCYPKHLLACAVHAGEGARNSDEFVTKIILARTVKIDLCFLFDQNTFQTC